MEQTKITREIVLDKLKKVKRDFDNYYFERHKKVLNTKQDILFVSMSNIRKVASFVFANDFYEYLENSKSNKINDEFYEETLVQGLVIAQIDNFDIQIKHFDCWKKKIDNWSTCDTVCSSLKNIKKSKQKDKYFSYFKNLCFSNDEFCARFGLVAILFNFIEKNYIDEIIDICKEISSEKYYINMAVSWLLSVCYVKFKEKTFNLIKEKTLSKFIQNKTISKIRDSFQVDKIDKENLKAYRK